MGMSTGGPRGFQSEINVTPLVDVVLVLLIIFMVIAPLALHGYDVDIPRAADAPAADAAEPEQIVLAVDARDCPATSPVRGDLPADCAVRLGEERVELDRLATRVAALYGERPLAGRVLFLAADERLNYEAVLRILDTARSGVEGLRIGFVTER